MEAAGRASFAVQGTINKLGLGNITNLQLYLLLCLFDKWGLVRALLHFVKA